jgi:hypothetical protein
VTSVLGYRKLGVKFIHPFFIWRFSCLPDYALNDFGAGFGKLTWWQCAKGGYPSTAFPPQPGEARVLAEVFGTDPEHLFPEFFSLTNSQAKLPLAKEA